MKTKLFFLLILNISIHASAQTGFQKMFQSSSALGFTTVYDQHVCANNDILIAGIKDSVKFIQKMGAAGNVIWTCQLMASSIDLMRIEEIGELGQGDCYVLGTNYSATDYPVFLIKINNSGSLVWSKEYSLSSFQASPYETSHLSIGTAGELILTISRALRMVLLKTDANGNFLWCKTLAATVNSAKNPAMCSVVLANNDIINFGKSGNDLTMLKLNSAGNALWSKIYTPPATCYFRPYSVIQTNDGNLVVSGLFSNWDIQLLGATLLKMDTSGTVLWQKIYNGTNLTSIFELSELSNGNLVGLGNGEDTLIHNGSLMMMTNSSGNVIRCARIHSFAQVDHIISSLSLTSDDKIIIGGSIGPPYSYNSQAFLFKTDTLFSGCNFSLDNINEMPVSFSATISSLQVDDPDGSEITTTVSLLPYSFSWLDYCTVLNNEQADFSETNISIFPVPVNQGENLYIKAGKINGDLQIALFNTEGKVVCENRIYKQEGLFTLNTSKFSKGLYIIHISSAGFNFNKKLIIR